MGKKGKNSNYQTAKTAAAAAERERAQKAKENKKKFIAIGGSIGVFLLIAGVIVGMGFALGWFSSDFAVTHHVNIEVEGYGTVHLELYGEEAIDTVYNFVALANEGFYNGLTFHRIIDGFMAQGGDPEGTGMGGSDREITGEFANNGVENNISHVRGVISMARASAKNSASSQFFIVHEDSTFLDKDYAGFGIVIEGIEVIDALCEDVAGWNADGNGVIPKKNQPVINYIKVIEG